jgi:hypothetical protein
MSIIDLRDKCHIGAAFLSDRACDAVFLGAMTQIVPPPVSSTSFCVGPPRYFTHSKSGLSPDAPKRLGADDRGVQLHDLKETLS